VCLNQENNWPKTFGREGNLSAILTPVQSEYIAQGRGRMKDKKMWSMNSRVSCEAKINYDFVTLINNNCHDVYLDYLTTGLELQVWRQNRH